MEAIRTPEVHIRFNGTSHDTDFADLDLSEMSTDDTVREAVANYLDAPLNKLRNFVVDRNEETGDITVRPSAIFGRFI